MISTRHLSNKRPAPVTKAKMETNEECGISLYTILGLIVIMAALVAPLFKRSGQEAPGDFVVEAAGTGPETALIVVFAPEETNHGLSKCYGEIQGSQGDRHSFSCEQRGGRSFSVPLKGLQPGSTYDGSMTFANVHNNEEVATRKDFTLRTSIAAPGDFKVQAAATGLTSALIVVFAPDKANGDLDKCYGEIRSPRGDKRTFTCDNHGGRTSTIELDQLELGTQYTGTVTFANVQGNEEAATEKLFTLTTHSGAPGDFDVEVRVTSSSSAVIVVHVPKVKNGPLDKCYGKISSRQGDIRSFGCNDHGGRSSVITLGALQAGTLYSAVVTFANVHEGKEAKTQKKFTLQAHIAAPGDFLVETKPTGASSLEVLVFVPQEPNGALDDCYGVLWGPHGVEHHFSCNDHGGRSSTVTLGGLQPSTMYQVEVTFVNIHEGEKMATQKVVSVKTSMWIMAEVVGVLVILLFFLVILLCYCYSFNEALERSLGMGKC